MLHCSATRSNTRYTFADCKRDHVENQHWSDIGYHYYIEKDGKLFKGRNLEIPGAHCEKHNQHSIGICYEGGLDEEGNYADTRTPEQCDTLFDLLITLKQQFPKARIYGHYEFNSTKHCPCFDVDEYRVIFNE